MGIEDEDLVPVDLPSGATHFVYRSELAQIQDLASRYLTDNAATNISDLQDIDRIVVLEVLCWRWGNWLSRRADYEWDPIDEKDLARQLKETSMELRQLKGSLGIDKVTREKQRGEGSISEYISNLKVRAKQFGVMRETQLDRALELFNELAGRIDLHDNCTEDERKLTNSTMEDIFAWLREEAIPSYNEIDEHFRENQKSWIRSM